MNGILECLKCNALCATCTGRLNTQCQTCSATGKKVEGRSECVAQCPVGFIEVAGNCAKCQSDCLSCNYC